MAPLEVNTKSLLAEILPGFVFIIILELPAILGGNSVIYNNINTIFDTSSPSPSIGVIITLLAILLVAGRFINYCRIRFALVPNKFKHILYYNSSDIIVLWGRSLIYYKLTQGIESRIKGFLAKNNELINKLVSRDIDKDSTKFASSLLYSPDLGHINETKVIDSILSEHNEIQENNVKKIYTTILKDLDGHESTQLREKKNLYIAYSNFLMAWYLGSILAMSWRIFDGQGPIFDQVVGGYLVLLMATPIITSFENAIRFLTVPYVEQLMFEYVSKNETELEGIYN